MQQTAMEWTPTGMREGVLIITYIVPQDHPERLNLIMQTKNIIYIIT
jgi:hypothetical protein